MSSVIKISVYMKDDFKATKGKVQEKQIINGLGFSNKLSHLIKRGYWQ